MNLLKFLCSLFFLFPLASKSQILNAYAKVSGITGTQLTVVNVNQSSHTFTVGGKVLIMQMQDDVIGSNTADVSTFGNLSSISSAGLYEIGTIASCSPATGTPTTITLSTALVNTYHTGANASLQLISYRNMGSNYTTTGTITGLAWDGNVGGVIAFEVTNTLTLNHPISADLIGFRKGLINSNAVAGTCLPTLFRTSSNSQAFKGEGIYKASDVNYTNARGKILNGGGGGNEHNGGGGGGGNYSAGGDGGFGYSCGTGVNSAGGLGGISLSGQIASNRIFMGGGGGGGQQNNTVGLDGGPGGGIILIKANTIATNTVCGSAIKITANGGSTASCGNDGAGGGGAAGTIVLQVNNYSASSTCPLSINADGGTGGSVGDGAEHGGGGGGGQGAVIFSAVQPTVNISTTTINGTGGRNNASGASFAGNGSGVNNTGILSMGGPLPVEFLSFTGEKEVDNVKLSWTTGGEKNTASFIVERSQDAQHFTTLGKVKATGSPYSTSHYDLYDESPSRGINYYRLKQVDHDTKYSYSTIVAIDFEHDWDFSLFPNPSATGTTVYVSLEKASSASVEITVFDLTGKSVFTQHSSMESGKATEINSFLPRGIYLVRVYTGNNSLLKKLVID
jgi:hypothetical protein